MTSATDKPGGQQKLLCLSLQWQRKKKKALETVKQQFIELSDPLAINSPFTKTSICHLFTLHALFINLFLIKCDWVLTESHRGGEDPERIAVSDLLRSYRSSPSFFFFYDSFPVSICFCLSFALLG